MATSSEEMIISEESVLVDETLLAEGSPKRLSTTPSSSSLSSEEEEEEEGVPAKGAIDQFINLSHWISCFCVVTFDLELGQAIEVWTTLYVYPCTYMYLPAIDLSYSLRG